MRLFVERAAAAAPGFVLDEENAVDVARICFRLDGLPLALELAAGRLGALAPAAIAERLDDGFRVLRTQSHASPTRQQTLKATLQWSHDLLEPDERTLFRRLAAFAGGFELETVESVCAGGGLDAPGIADVLARLVEKSLVVSDEGSSRERRYRLLEDRSPVCARAPQRGGRNRHAARACARRCAALLRRAGTVLVAPDRPPRGASAIRPGPRRRPAPHDARSRGAARRGGYRPSQRRARARACAGRGELRRGIRDWRRARRALEEALERRRAQNDRRGLGFALAGLGFVDTTAGDYDSAQRHLAEARDLFRRAGDRWALASTLWRTADLAFARGNLDDAEAALLEARTVLGPTQRERWIANTLTGLAEVALLRGDEQRAGALLADARDRYAARDDALGVADAEERLSDLAKRALSPGK